MRSSAYHALQDLGRRLEPGDYHRGYLRSLRVAMWDMPLPDEHRVLLRRAEYRHGFEGRAGGEAAEAAMTIDLSAFAALLEHHHQLGRYCPSCRRWGVVDLERLVARAAGCAGRGGEWQVRPTLPRFEGATWMQ